MGSKIANLQSRLSAASGKSSPAEVIPQPVPAAVKAPSREGKIHVGAWVAADYKRSLRLIQAKTDKGMEQLITEALNDLFAKYDVPIIRQE